MKVLRFAAFLCKVASTKYVDIAVSNPDVRLPGRRTVLGVQAACGGLNSAHYRAQMFTGFLPNDWCMQVAQVPKEAEAATLPANMKMHRRLLEDHAHLVLGKGAHALPCSFAGRCARVEVLWSYRTVPTVN